MLDETRAAAEDAVYMRRALVLAERGWGHTAPNPMVGAVVVRDGVIAGEGWHRQYGGPHAEVNAIAAAGDSARGATMYVTLEPCNHFGKTPPCTDAIIEAGIARVVAAVKDPSPHGAGGEPKLRAAGARVEFGPEEHRARELNAIWFHALTTDRPFVALKLALSAEGAIARGSRSQRWLTGAEARLEVHRLRAGFDAIAVGIGTVLADDPLLTVRGEISPRVPPMRVVFDRTGRLPLDSRIVNTAKESSVVVVGNHFAKAGASALDRAGVERITASGLRESLEELGKRRISSVLVEGGAGIASELLRNELVDRVIIFQTRVELGSTALPAFGSSLESVREEIARWTSLCSQQFGDDLMTVYEPVAKR